MLAATFDIRFKTQYEYFGGDSPRMDRRRNQLFVGLFLRTRLGTAPCPTVC